VPNIRIAIALWSWHQAGDIRIMGLNLGNLCLQVATPIINSPARVSLSLEKNIMRSTLKMLKKEYFLVAIKLTAKNVNIFLFVLWLVAICSML